MQVQEDPIPVCFRQILRGEREDRHAAEFPFCNVNLQFFTQAGECFCRFLLKGIGPSLPFPTGAGMGVPLRRRGLGNEFPKFGAGRLRDGKRVGKFPRPGGENGGTRQQCGGHGLFEAVHVHLLMMKGEAGYGRYEMGVQALRPVSLAKREKLAAISRAAMTLMPAAARKMPLMPRLS